MLYDMIYYVKLCYVSLCYGTLCYVMSYDINMTYYLLKKCCGQRVTVLTHNLKVASSNYAIRGDNAAAVSKLLKFFSVMSLIWPDVSGADVKIMHIHIYSLCYIILW